LFGNAYPVHTGGQMNPKELESTEHIVQQ